jgi:hypothetical protein
LKGILKVLFINLDHEERAGKPETVFPLKSDSHDNEKEKIESGVNEKKLSDNEIFILWSSSFIVSFLLSKYLIEHFNKFI